MKQNIVRTARTKVRRMKERANYDEAAIHSLIDASPFATIAFTDGLHVHAIPTAIWREENHLYVHGSNGSRLLKILATGVEVCISVTRIDGFVLARSAFHHSMNYQSVCIYGIFETVGQTAKNMHFQRFLEHWLPGRWQHTRTPNKKELAATTILRIPIVEAVLKSRQGPPKDDIEDMDQKVWAGVIPLEIKKQLSQQVPEQNNANLPGDKIRFN